MWVRQRPEKNAVLVYQEERKQNKFGGDTQSKAIELANGFTPNNVRFFDQTEVDKQVVLIMQRAKVDASIIGQQAFDDLKANITSVIKTKVDNANAAQVETDTRAFNQTISSNAMFIKAGMTNGWDSQELLDIYNTHRRNYGLSEATSVNDPNFKDVAHIANIHNRTNYKENFNKERDRVQGLVDKQVEAIAKNINAEASGFDKKSSGFIAISGMINQGMMLLPNVDPTEVRAIIENQFGANAVNGDKSDVETIKKIRQALSNLFISKQQFKAQLMEQSMQNVGYPPDTNFDQVSKNDIKEFGQSFTAYMRTQRAKMTVNIDPESPQFERILSNLEQEADVYIDKMLAFYRKSKGAFETFGTGDDGTTITMEKRLEELEAVLIQQKDDMLKDLRNGDQRGTKLPPQSYEPTGTASGLNQQGYVKMKVNLTKRVMNDATGDYEEVPVTYKDTNIPVKAGDIVKIDQNGDITSYQTTVTQGSTNIVSRITADPGKVGQELLSGGRDFSQFMPPSMGGGIDTNTTNQQMAQTIKNMYQAFIQSGTPLPSYPTPGSFGRSTTQVTNEREFAKAILSGITQYNSRGYGFTNQGILNLFP